MQTHDVLTSTAAWRQLKWHGLTSLTAPYPSSVISISKTSVSRDAPCISVEHPVMPPAGYLLLPRLWSDKYQNLPRATPLWLHNRLWLRFPFLIVWRNYTQGAELWLACHLRFTLRIVSVIWNSTFRGPHLCQEYVGLYLLKRPPIFGCFAFFLWCPTM